MEPKAEPSLRPELSLRPEPSLRSGSPWSSGSSWTSRSSWTSGPPWMWALAGWLVASSQLGPIWRSVDEGAFSARIPVAARATSAGAPAVSDPDRMSPRELRRLPAIGPARALAIARARWERGLSGGPEAWEDVPGIGPETVGRIRRALAEAVESSRVVRSP